MAKIYEKRKDTRYKVNASLIYQINLSGNNYRAKKLDHSHAGLAFQSNYALKPGTVVFIRRESCPSNCPGGRACEGCRTVTLSTVKWRRQIEDASLMSYLTGAKYY